MEKTEIINALVCCTQKDEEGWLCPVCVDCPFSIGKDDCKALDEYALALIKELQAHIENLKKENKYLRERLAEEAEIKEDMSVSELKAKIEELEKGELCKAFTFNKKTIDNIYTEAREETVKKMQELIKERCIEGGIYPAFVASTIDKIAKEILEGTK